jgi:hypothetical protein
MKGRYVLMTLSTIPAGLTAIFLQYWVNTQPVWIVTDSHSAHDSLPSKNSQIINFIESNGKHTAPAYEKVVCTEFVINVIEHFEPLTAADKKKIRIITDSDLTTLIREESTVIRGVQAALSDSKKGVKINPMQELMPGDFVQFWNVYHGIAFGHCGVLMSAEPGKTITLYSSHPATNGFGRQTFLWPDKLYVVRLQ